MLTFFIAFQLKDKEKFQEALEDLKTVAPGAESPPVPDPSTAVESTGKYHHANMPRHNEDPFKCHF